MKKIALFTVIIVAILFRFAKLADVPPGLNWDEVSIGYNAYSIGKTAKDEWGQLLPLSFKAFGEVKLPGMIYASVPGVMLFGPTDFGVRVTPAIIGVVGVIVIYFLGKRLLGSADYGVAGAFLLAVSPWAVHFSRVSFESGLAMVLMMTSLYFVLLGRAKTNNLWIGMIFAVLAVYTYNSMRILLPLLFLTYVILKIIVVNKQNILRMIPIIVVGFLLLIPSITSLMSKDGQIRWNVVSITGHKGFYDQVAESRGYLYQLPGPLPRLIHNKFTHYITTAADNYVKTFSTEFLFFKGSDNTQRSVQGMGLLYLFELPLFLIGLLKIFGKKEVKAMIPHFLLPLLLMAPIPSAITTDSPSSVRALSMLPALLLIEAVGLVSVVKFLSTKSMLLKIFATLLVVWNISYFASQLFYVYPVKYADDWQYGYKEIIEYAKNKEDQVDHIYITSRYGEPYIYTLFYTGYDPKVYQTENVQRNIDPTGWVHVTGFGKYHFTDFAGLEMPHEIVSRNKGKILMIGGFAQLPAEFAKDYSVKAPNWIDMFETTIQEGKN